MKRPVIAWTGEQWEAAFEDGTTAASASLSNLRDILDYAEAMNGPWEPSEGGDPKPC